MEWLNKPGTIKPETTCLVRICYSRDSSESGICGAQFCVTKMRCMIDYRE